MNNILASSSSDETLVSNTGLKSQPEFVVAIDWLDITFRSLDGAEHARQVVRDLEVITTDSIEFSPTLAVFNGHRWDGSGRGAKGVLLWYQAKHDDEKGHPWPAQLKVSMPGSVLAQSDLPALALYLAKIANHLIPECTRIDIALDDRKKFVSLEQIIEARRAGNFFNASYSAEITSGNRGQTEGRTIYFGAPSSDKRLRIYDKTVESQGKIEGNRWEAQFRRKAAHQVFSSWVKFEADDPGVVPRILQNYIVGLIDFRERDSDDPNRDRFEPVAWFKALCSVLRAKPARVRVRAVVQSMQKSIDWIIKSAAPSIFSLKSVLGDDFPKFLDEVLSVGSQRLSNIRRKLLLEADKSLLDY